MARCRVVTPDTVRLPISDGDWIDVKKELNAGENKRMLRRGFSPTDGGFDGIAAGTAKMVAYLVDWSLKGLDGKVIPLRDKSPSDMESALDSIDPDSYSEILKAVEAHETAMTAEREQEKNAQDGAIGSSAISPSAG